MTDLQNITLVMIPAEDLESIKNSQQKILQQLQALDRVDLGSIPVKNITAKEFMAAIRICRTKFDRLVSMNKIRIIKTKRKIYVPVSEVERYFNDPGIQ